MKVTFKGLNGVTMRSQGINFQIGVEYEVSEKVAEYLVGTFGEAFEAKIVEKPKATPKPKPKPTTKKAEDDK